MNQSIERADQTNGRVAAPGAVWPEMRRIQRRETHSSRATVASVTAILIIMLCAYALLESTMRAIGQPAWLVDYQATAERIMALPKGIPPLLLGVIGAVIAMAGLFLFLKAVLPGRRARHRLDDPLAAIVVDDEVIASALARRARLAANVTPEQVLVVVSQRQVVVSVRPTSGVPIAENTVSAAVEDELIQMAPVPMPAVRVNLATSGVVGA